MDRFTVYISLAITCAVCALAISSDENIHQTIHSIDADPIPVWPRLFSMEFNETSIILFKRMTSGW